MTDFHGWRANRGEYALHIGRLPGRRRVALYFDLGGSIVPAAYFRTEHDARNVLEFIDGIAGIASETPYEVGESDPALLMTIEKGLGLP